MTIVRPLVWVTWGVDSSTEIGMMCVDEYPSCFDGNVKFHM